MRIWKLAAKTPYLASAFCVYMLAEGTWEPGAWEWGVAAAAFLILGLFLNYGHLWFRKTRLSPARAPHKPVINETVTPALDEDEETVKQNPGNHAAVVRLIVNAETVEEADSLFNNYIDSPSHHPAYEIEVVTVHYLKLSQLLEGEERDKWYIGQRNKIIRTHNYSREQFIKVMSDTWEKYPELLEGWER